MAAELESPPVKETTLKGDLIAGIEAIAELLDDTPRRTHYLLTKGLVPGAFRRGNRWFALRSEVIEGFRRLARGEAA